MVKEIWINLPVKNISASKDFYQKMGFKFNPRMGNGPESISLLVGQKEVPVMLFEEKMFSGFAGSGINDTSASAEVLLSIDAELKEEVDEMAKKAVDSGGKSKHVPKAMDGWMYGCLFTDPDGHRWNVLYMDQSKMPKH